ncbi:hypothetical protein L9F63_027811, partial [Diploptera punctata]
LKHKEFEKEAQMFGIRHLQAFLLFLGLIVAYSLRVDMSVAIVAMTNQTSTGVDFPEYKWDSETRSTVLSSFFWGYVVTQIPAGQLAQRFGAKILLTGSLFVASLFTILTPLAADLGGAELTCGSRVIQGLAQGFIFPSIHTLLSSWTPMEERGRLATYVYAGSQVGTIITMSLSGKMSSTIGWPSIFYLFGGIGIGWAVLWFFFGADHPRSAKFISKAEKDYIETNLGSIQSTDNKRSTPWAAIFTSLPMWALILAHCGQNWGFWTLLTEMPSYMNDVLGFDIGSNGLLSALPYLVMWLTSFLFSWVSDILNSRQLISLATSRKLFNSIAHWIPGVTLIALAFSSKEDTTLPVVLLTIAVGVNSGTYLGFQLNHIDLSPNYAGTLMGITNCAANIMSIIGPLLVDSFVLMTTVLSYWAACKYISLCCFFLEFFGRLYQILPLRVYRKHDRSLQGPISWIKQQVTSP